MDPEFEHRSKGQPPLHCPFRLHSLRHLYASHSLTSRDAGGLGWSLGFVQRCMGHSDARITQAVYRHVTDLEYLDAVTTPHAWPGL